MHRHEQAPTDMTQMHTAILDSEVFIPKGDYQSFLPSWWWVGWVALGYLSPSGSLG